MELVIMRHGPTPGNRARRYIGATDEPLDAEGRAAARFAGVHPEVKEVYVSPLARARQTAALCFPNATQRVVDGLREMDFGAFEGGTYEDLQHDAAYRAWLDGGSDAMCPGGESQRRFVRRTNEAMADVLRSAVRRKAEEDSTACDRVVVVAHGGTVMATFSEHAIPSRPYFDWAVPHCEGYRAVVEARCAGMATGPGELLPDEPLAFALRDPVHFRSLDFLG